MSTPRKLWRSVRFGTGLLLGTLMLSVALAACSSTSDTKTETPVEEKPNLPAFQPTEAALRRLSGVQYRNTIRDVLGPEVVVPSKLEPDDPSGGLIAMGSSLTSVSSRGVEQYETAAYEIAKQTFAPGAVRDRVMSCQPAGMVDEACASTVLRALGLHLWRRPLLDEEVAGLVALTTKAATTLTDFHKGMEFGLAALLQSPNFLFRNELGVDDPAHPGWRSYTAYEMASRLSFFLWNTSPDDELLQAAEQGKLTTDDGLSEQADRLMADQRMHDGIQNFFNEMFQLYKLDGLSKDPKVFVHMNADVGAAAKQETLLGIDNFVFTEQGDYRDWYTTRTTFLNRKLASIYNVRSPVKEGFGKYEYTEDSPRLGFLGQVSFLALNAHPTSSSATLRGKFIRQTLLCGSIPPPPAMANTALPEPSGTSLTLRDRVKEHLQNPTCAACHNKMDPIGLGLENFDGLGVFREKDNGVVIDASGDIDGRAYQNPRALSFVIHDHPDLPKCLVRTMYRYAYGHEEELGESQTLYELTQSFKSQNYRILDLVKQVVMHPHFRLAAPPSNQLEGEAK
jgi:hypothetical protein